MKTQGIPELKEAWEKMNAEYDGYVQSFLDEPGKKFSEEEIQKFKDMQTKLYELETTLFAMIQQEIEKQS